MDKPFLQDILENYRVYTCFNHPTSNDSPSYSNEPEQTEGISCKIEHWSKQLGLYMSADFFAIDKAPYYYDKVS